MAKRPRIISEFLRTDSKIRELLSKNHSQQKLLIKIRALLPSPLNQHCHAVVTEERRIILYTDSSAWASRLRFFSKDLSTQLNQHGIRVEKVTIRVMIGNSPKKTRHHTPRHLSRSNADLVVETADAISDPELSAALKRLSRHGR
ncbi:MAG: DciA family protein [Candidatus Sedimenticola sp. PURPLELP]